MKLSVTAKILLASLATTALVAWLIRFNVETQESLAESMNEMIERNMAAMRMAEQVKYTFVLYDDLLFRYLFTGDRALLSESQRVRGRVHKSIGDMKALVRGQTEQELLAEIAEEGGRYERDLKLLFDTHTFSTEEQKKSVVDLVKALEAGGSPLPVRQSQKQTLALLSAEGRARLVRIYSLCEKLVDISRAKLEDAQRRVQESMARSRRLALRAGAGAAAGTLLVAFLLAVSLLRPLQNLLRGVKRATDGDLSLEIPVEGSDEIGRLTQAFNSMIRNLREKQEKLTTETITDSLTELFNFRYFQLRVKDEVARALRYKHTFALLIIDIDHFKHFNDANGHQMGNVILNQVAAVVKETLRAEDFLARYGGEEFAAILPEIDARGARVVAGRIREAMAAADFPGERTQPGGKLSVSIGGAMFPADGTAVGQLIEKADKALYAAKAAGRNRVVWSEEV